MPTDPTTITTLREFAEALIAFPSLTGEERAANEFVADVLDARGFDTYRWEGDPELLSEHRSFPDDPADIDTADRPSVAGVLTAGDPGPDDPTLVLNGHIDVVPADADSWTTRPFEPTSVEWEGGEGLRGRGAADMKSALAACVFAAEDARDRLAERGVDARLVVESVVDEEAGGIGAAAAAHDNPYPFERTAALVAEPTELAIVTACEGTVMKRLEIPGRPAHAATRWLGESPIPRFIQIHQAFNELERERATEVTHPLYDEFEIPWPVLAGTIQAGEWPSSVPSSLTAEYRIGVAPGESVRGVERAFEERLAEAIADDPWLRENPPTFERFDVQFEPHEIDPTEPVVAALAATLDDHGLASDPRGATYGTDARHYVEAGIPTVVFGPGSIDQAHFPDETVPWDEVSAARELLGEFAVRFLTDA